MLDNQPENSIMKNRCECRRTPMAVAVRTTTHNHEPPFFDHPPNKTREKPSNSNSFTLPLPKLFMFSFENAFGWMDGWIFVVKYNLLFHRVTSISIPLRQRQRRRRQHTRICTHLHALQLIFSGVHWTFVFGQPITLKSVFNKNKMLLFMFSLCALFFLNTAYKMDTWCLFLLLLFPLLCKNGQT